MVLRMARPTKRKGTDNVQYKKRIPADVKEVLANLPPQYRPKGWGKNFITISTGTADKKDAAKEFARIGAEVEERFASLRLGVRSLTHKETVALAGTVYEVWSQAMEDSPGSTALWDSVLVNNVKARAGKYGRASLLIGADAKRSASMDERFGSMVDAVLSREGLLIDQQSRLRLLEEVALALDRAASKLRRNAEGDYSPDESALKYSTWQNPAQKNPKNKLGLMDLFNTWASHPEQSAQAPRTVSRYRGVFDAFALFTKGAAADEITTSDVRRFTEDLMVNKDLGPRTVRDVHKAAISSVFNWALGKGLVQNNPASGVSIKVKKSVSPRPLEITDSEAHVLVAPCNAIGDVAPQTLAAAQKWCPLICLYTGARIGEVTQLRKEDFRRHGQSYYIRITPEAGSVKDREFRDVPIHSRLVSLGLRAFIEAAPEGPLFYDLSASRRTPEAKTPQSEVVSKHIVKWAKKGCLTDPLLERPMHGLRHRFIKLARQAGIDPQYIEAITGHAPSGQNSRYGSFDISTLIRELQRLRPEQVEGDEKF